MSNYIPQNPNDPFSHVKPGDPEHFRTKKHLVSQARGNQALRGVAAGAAGLVDQAGPPYWDRHAWDQFFQQTGRYPFTAEELPPNFEGCPAWAYQLMGLRPPLMAR